MPGYPVLNIEITDPSLEVCLSTLKLPCAIVLRRKGSPIDFLLPGEIPIDATVDDVLRLMKERAGPRWTEVESKDVAHHNPTIQFPTITAAICTRDRSDRLARCLTSLTSVTLPAGFPSTHFTILVVDNAPATAETKAIVAGYPGIRYVCEPRPGLDFARNRAWKEAQGSIIAYLDDDVVADAEWLKGFLDAYRAFPDAAAFTGLVLPYQLETEAQLLFEKREGFRKGFARTIFGQGIPSDPLFPARAQQFGVGANMAFVREVLEEIGGFDDALDAGPTLPGGGDLDIFYRILRTGHRLVYEPRFLVFHEHRQEISALRRQYFGWGLSFMAFLTKSIRADRGEWRKLLSLLLSWSHYQLVLLIRGVAGKREYRPDFVLAEVAGGIIGLCGKYSRSLRRVERIRESQ
jgi:glycosyltransferase involved in cell wall biosynthesis